MDEQYVYWVNEGTPAIREFGAGVVRIPKAGGEPLPLYCHGYQPPLGTTGFDATAVATGGGWLLAWVARGLVTLPK